MDRLSQLTKRNTIERKGAVGIAALVLLLTLLSGVLASCGNGDDADDAGPSVGNPAPTFTLPTADGGTVSLADFEGRQPVLLFFHMADG
jgi:cytochrome oxidase Cu insertion factor (SCO1/SenC/PrrC family)